LSGAKRGRDRGLQLAMQRHVRATVAGDADDRRGVAGERVGERAAQPGHVVDIGVRAAVERRRVAEVQAVRRGDVLLEDVARPRDREKLEDPAAELAETDVKLAALLPVLAG